MTEPMECKSDVNINSVTMDYYPYGEPFREWNWDLAERVSSLSPNRYLYNGNERETGLGVNMYDFNARTYVASYPFFTRPDTRCREFPWLNPYAFCGGDPINLSDPTGQKPNEYEGALMAAIPYNDGDANRALDLLENTDWKVFNLLPDNILKPYGDKGAGVQATVFRRSVDGRNEYVCAFAGTQGIFDIIEDVLQLDGWSPQYYQTLSVAGEVINALTQIEGEGFELTFVGHSMGGGEATLSSMKTDFTAMTYNPAVPSAKSMLRSGTIMKYRNADVTNYISSTPSVLGYKQVVDPVTLYQNRKLLFAPGTTEKVSVGWLPSHGIMPMIKTMGKGKYQGNVPQ